VGDIEAIRIEQGVWHCSSLNLLLHEVRLSHTQVLGIITTGTIGCRVCAYNTTVAMELFCLTRMRRVS
jgi:hypothetical protein